MKKVDAEKRLGIVVGLLCGIGLISGCCFSLMYFFEKLYSQMALSLIVTTISFGFAFLLLPVAEELGRQRKKAYIEQLQ